MGIQDGEQGRLTLLAREEVDRSRLVLVGDHEFKGIVVSALLGSIVMQRPKKKK